MDSRFNDLLIPEMENLKKKGIHVFRFEKNDPVLVTEESEYFLPIVEHFKQNQVALEFTFSRANKETDYYRICNLAAVFSLALGRILPLNGFIFNNKNELAPIFTFVIGDCFKTVHEKLFTTPGGIVPIPNQNNLLPFTVLLTNDDNPLLVPSLYTFKEVMTFLQQGLEGLSHLHNHGYAHGNVRLNSILIRYETEEEKVNKTVVPAVLFNSAFLGNFWTTFLSVRQHQSLGMKNGALLHSGFMVPTVAGIFKNSDAATPLPPQFTSNAKFTFEDAFNATSTDESASSESATQQPYKVTKVSIASITSEDGATQVVPERREDIWQFGLSIVTKIFYSDDSATNEAFLKGGVATIEADRTIFERIQYLFGQTSNIQQYLTKPNIPIIRDFMLQVGQKTPAGVLLQHNFFGI